VGQGRQNVLGSFATCGPFRELAGTLYREAYWLVADHLGTPRMIVNKSGSLASVKRHDYLPFGEEIGGPQVALIGGRTRAQGYVGDGSRLKFTKKERDIEPGLDFFGSRYYSSLQGRFSSPDHFRGNPASLFRGNDQSSALPFSSSGDPQTLNAYTYVYNNPLSYHDPDGHRGTRHKPVPHSGRYTYRADISNLNDSPNLHIFDRKGTEIGRVAIKGDLDNPRFEWEPTSTVPESVKANVEALITEQIGKGKWLPRPSLWQEETPSGFSGTGGIARVNAALMFLHIFLEAYNTYYDEKHYGYSYDMMGKIVISDLALAKQYLPTGYYEIEGYLFHFANGTFTSVDERCSGCTVESDYPGDLHVKHPVVEVRPKTEEFREHKNGYRQRV
jgi:RHS repeat-associated protein